MTILRQNHDFGQFIEADIIISCDTTFLKKVDEIFL